MKAEATEPSQSPAKKAFFLAVSLLLLIVISTNFFRDSPASLSAPIASYVDGECDVYTGKWVHSPSMPYYTNSTCYWIIPQQDCLKFGRPDLDFLKWRWKPDRCQLPLFDAAQFLEIVRGKSMAFVGDSVGRNQMQSLLCLLSSVAYPTDISDRYAVDTAYFKRWYYPEYTFQIAALWSPFLVKSRDGDPNSHVVDKIMRLYLDEADEAWTGEIEKFDYVIINAGQWFFRPFMYYENNELVGCIECYREDVTELTRFYGYRKAFQTAYRTLQSLKNFRGMTILRTFSPAHFENGKWNTGGSCIRKKPFNEDEVTLEGESLEFYLTQIEEFRIAQKEAERKGLKFRMMDTTQAMLLRPDGHPNHYSLPPHGNTSISDCVHWCTPGPVDTWNEFLLHLLRSES